RLADAVAAVAGHEDLFAHDDRAGRSSTRKLRFPDYILLGAPGGRQILVCGDAEPTGAAELEPVGMKRGRQECGCQQRKGKNSCSHRSSGPYRNMGYLAKGFS